MSYLFVYDHIHLVLPLQVLQCAMVTFDLMDSLVVRIEELTEDRAAREP